LINNSITIILCGSFAKNLLITHSDIDVVVVKNTNYQKESQPFLEEQCNKINVHYFLYNEIELYDIFTSESGSIDRKCSSLVGSGTVVHGDIDIGNKIIQAAKHSLSVSIPQIERWEVLYLYNYIKNELQDEIELLFNNSKYGFNQLVNDMMNKYYVLIHKIHSKLLIRYKEMDSFITSIPNEKCCQLYCNILVEKDEKVKKNLFLQLSLLISERLSNYL
jgi:hypothetical protein